MRFYPELPSRRLPTVAGDVLVVLLLLLLARLGLWVHDAVDDLAVLGQGVQDAGSAVERSFEEAAGAVAGTPVIGDTLREGLEEAGRGSGGEAVDAGRAGEDGAHRLADILGLVVFLLPAAILLVRFLPGRIDQIRALTAASRVLSGPDREERRRLVAMRAAFSLPYGTLLRHTRDPLGDLEAGRYDSLVAAARAQAGLRPEA